MAAEHRVSFSTVEAVAALQTFVEIPVELLWTPPDGHVLVCPECGSVVPPAYAVVHRRKCGGGNGR